MLSYAPEIVLFYFSKVVGSSLRHEVFPLLVDQTLDILLLYTLSLFEEPMLDKQCLSVQNKNILFVYPKQFGKFQNCLFIILTFKVC